MRPGETKTGLAVAEARGVPVAVRGTRPAFPTREFPGALGIPSSERFLQIHLIFVDLQTTSVHSRT